VSPELDVPMRRFVPTAIRRFRSAQDGATAIEYALIASGIAGAIIAVVTTLGGSMNTMWTHVSNIFN
jgi:pilus assembly protein Flp/PilA